MSATRRSVIAGGAGSPLLARQLPLRVTAEQRAAQAAPRDYVRLSSALLGVEPVVLEPAPRPGAAPLADTFHALCAAAAPAALAALLAEYGRRAGAVAPAAVAQRLLETRGSPRTDGVGALARLTMMMWLYGIWYGRTETTRVAASANVLHTAYHTDAVVSVHAYRNAWIWRFAQTTPAGVAGAPGAWSEPPPGLAELRGEA